jgi:hypothetical protein
MARAELVGAPTISSRASSLRRNLMHSKWIWLCFITAASGLASCDDEIVDVDTPRDAATVAPDGGARDGAVADAVADGSTEESSVDDANDDDPNDTVAPDVVLIDAGGDTILEGDADAEAE